MPWFGLLGMLYSMAVLATTLGCEHQWMLTGWVRSCTRDRVAHVLLNTGFTKATVASGGEATYPTPQNKCLTSPGALGISLSFLKSSSMAPSHLHSCLVVTGPIQSALTKKIGFTQTEGRHLPGLRDQTPKLGNES